VKVLAYTSPARGHLNPMMGPLLELRRRGAEVHVRTLAPAVESVRAAGLIAEPIDPAIEAILHDDHLAATHMASGARSYNVFKERAPHEVPDFEAALDAVAPDLALVDCTTYGAKAVAERNGIPWAESQPFLLQEPVKGLPMAGLGMRPARSPLGTVRDSTVKAFGSGFDQRFRLPPVNAGRRAAGLPRLDRLAESYHRSALTLYWTAEPFDYPRPLPANVRMVGPGVWDPPGAEPVALPAGDRPLVLVACSSEFQDDGEIAATALAGLRDRYRLVVTTAGVDPAGLGDHGDALVERFLPHAEILPHADAVVCHGGMGVTQKALSFGVPVCVVPWGRDQLDVAAHVLEAEAGTRVSRRKLSPARLAAAVDEARDCRPGAARVKAGYEATGGTSAATDALEALVTNAAV
jgi:UDP:flavonoid glycosyltransferase YjiC (YdhE family)